MTSYSLYLNGQWRQPGPPIDVTNPAIGEVVGQVATVDRAEVAEALTAAEGVFASWRQLPAKQRGDYLTAVADSVQARADEIARVITLENGKPLPQSKGEVAMAIDHLRWFAAEAPRAYGRIVPHQVDGKRHLIVKSPVGVVGAIAPWNFPLVLAVRKVAPAMAAGCPVLLKPSSSTPISSVMLGECMEAAGVPAGVFQLVVGKAADIAAEFLENPVCRKISFTGSTEVGRELIAGSARNVTSLSLELGGHAPVIVFEDADIDLAVQGAIITKFRNTGQSCIASNRIYVHRPIYDCFVEAFVAQATALKVGNGLDESVEIGPLIDAAALDTALAHIADAVAGGAKVMCGGKRTGGTGHDAGCFLEPTVLVDVPADARCMREETFAPVAPVCVFDDEDEAVRRANDTCYGLAAYAFTRDLNRALRLAEQLDAGTIALNDAVPATSQCPFGGMKQSGLGRELGIEGLDAYLETKHVSIGAVT